MEILVRGRLIVDQQLSKL